mgnify:CR=1 FL=1
MPDDLITAVERSKKGAVVTLNGEEKIFVSRALLIEREFTEGLSLQRDELAQWLLPRQYPEALNLAVSLLAQRAHSSGEIEKKLRDKFYLPETVEMVLYKLEKEHFLNDEAFATEYAASLSRRQMGRTRITQELRRKGIAPELIQQALEALGIAAAVNERADHDRAHIDHGVDVSAVQRLVAGVDRVKGLAGGLDADAALHGLDAVVQQRLKQQDRLDHALDGKGLAAVSRPALLPVVADHIDAEHRRVCLGQLRDIICKTALRGIRQALRQQAFKKLFHNRLPFVLRREQARR